MIVTFEQAKMLANIGYDEYTPSAYFNVESLGMANEIPKGTTIKDTYQAPTVSDALQWIRVKKKLPCAVTLYYDNDDTFFYIGEYRIERNKMFESSPYDTYSLAESALLDAILVNLTEIKK